MYNRKWLQSFPYVNQQNTFSQGNRNVPRYATEGHWIDPSMYPLYQSQWQQAFMMRQVDNLIAEAHGDVDGDGLSDRVFLYGHKTENSPYWRNLRLVVQNGRTNQQTQIPLKANQGYNPSLFLGNFTGNHAEEILVISDTGGSGGAIYAEMYMYDNGYYKRIFQEQQFNDRYKYKVSYEDDYKVSVISQSLNETYLIDLHYKGGDYLAEIYTTDGKLKQPINGWVNPLSGLYPIDYNRDGIYELTAYQRIAGQYNADSLGGVQTVLSWNGRRFEPIRQAIAIEGAGRE